MPYSIRSKNETIELLSQLGLSSAQAKVYFALNQLGTSKTLVLSHYSGVARPDIYRIVKDLNRLGLVSKSIERPFNFNAIPMNEGVALLLKRKKDEDEQLETTVGNLLEKLQSPELTEAETQSGNVEFVPKKEYHTKRIEQLIDEAQISSDVIGPIDPTKSTFRYKDETIRNAISRGVKVRVIVGDVSTSKDVAAFFKKWEKCEFRVLKSPVKIAMAIYDSKRVIIRETVANGSFYDANALVIDNSSIVETLTDYFEMLWQTSPDAQVFKQLEDLQNL
ncbi:MAG: hypothetical protein NWF05_08080 [Candidatus Bathyarchaeota archaeon]|nr:hypothetical protein [Candidatus Bathyarchaeota archaeon]